MSPLAGPRSPILWWSSRPAGNADFGYPADPVRINEPGRTLWVRVGYRD